MLVSSRYCKSASAIVPETWEPMATPLSGWYIWSPNEKQFCFRIVLRSVIIWWVVCLSLFFVSWSFVSFRLS